MPQDPELPVLKATEAQGEQPEPRHKRPPGLRPLTLAFLPLHRPLLITPHSVTILKYAGAWITVSSSTHQKQKPPSQTPAHISWEPNTITESFNFLCTHISSLLKWSINTEFITKKAHIQTKPPPSVLHSHHWKHSHLIPNIIIIIISQTHNQKSYEKIFIFDPSHTACHLFQLMPSGWCNRYLSTKSSHFKVFSPLQYGPWTPH